MTRQVHHRKEHGRAALSEAAAGPDPIALFHQWLDEAVRAGLPEPNAMALATLDANGVSCRIVLLRSFDEGGFVFFTNHNSRKAMQLEDDAHAALTFFWPELERQVRIEGSASPIAAEESDAYFRSRPRGCSDRGMGIGPKRDDQRSYRAR